MYPGRDMQQQWRWCFLYHKLFLVILISGKTPLVVRRLLMSCILYTGNGVYNAHETMDYRGVPIIFVCCLFLSYVVLTVSRKYTFRVGTRTSCASKKSRILSRINLCSGSGEVKKRWAARLMRLPKFVGRSSSDQRIL
jgi:hypothetical protein